jgi:hypothetical protein
MEWQAGSVQELRFHIQSVGRLRLGKKLEVVTHCVIDSWPGPLLPR